MTSQTDLQTIDLDLQMSLSRSFLTALTLLGDAKKSEALVMEAIESLEPQNVTSRSVRDAVLRLLVEEQVRCASGCVVCQSRHQVDR